MLSLITVVVHLLSFPPGKQHIRSCPLYKQAKRLSAHFLSECRFLPESDRKYLAKARQIQGIIDTDSDIEDTEETPTFKHTVCLVSSHVSIMQTVTVFGRLPSAHPHTLNY